jgi:DNA repair and recombination protein RAD52
VSYLEGWKAIELANAIFGFNGWSSSVESITGDFCDLDKERGQWKAGVTAMVRVTLKDGTSHEDVGFGSSENKIKATAIENAKKEAVTDARKRTLRLFGNALGNSVYDKVHTGHEVKSNKGGPKIPKGPVSFAGLRSKVKPDSHHVDLTSGFDAPEKMEVTPTAPIAPKAEPPATPVSAVAATIPHVPPSASPSHAPEAGNPVPHTLALNVNAQPSAPVQTTKSFFRSSPPKTNVAPIPPLPAPASNPVTALDNSDLDDFVDYEQVVAQSRKESMDAQHKTIPPPNNSAVPHMATGIAGDAGSSSQSETSTVAPSSGLTAAEKAAQISAAMIGVDFDD